MAAELRWILSGLSALLLIGIWWWGVRRSRKMPGNALLREPNTGSATMGPTIGAPTAEHYMEDAASRPWGVPPFEPLSIRTADFEPGQPLDLPMTAIAPPIDETLDTDYDEHGMAAKSQFAAAEPAEPPKAAEPAAPAYAAEARGTEARGTEAHGTESQVPDLHALDAPALGTPWTESPAAAPPSTSATLTSAATAATPNTSETQRIITVRVCALDDAHWRGADLLTALEKHGLGYGRYKVFHRTHHDGRTLFCAASLVEPGTFDIVRMPEEQFRGLTLFAVLPGPADALETIDTLIGTAVELADTLHGAVQDAKGAPLSAQRAEALREDVVRFQESLSKV